jgi:uncharacterized protein YacL
VIQGAGDPLLTLVRSLLVALGALVGYVISYPVFAPDSLNRVYVTLLGGLVASLLVRRPAKIIRDFLGRVIDSVVHLPPQTVLAGTVATIAALVISVLLNNLLSSVPGFAWYFQLGVTLILEVFFVFFAVQNREWFTPIAGKPVERIVPSGAVATKLLDTSVIIDGRIAEVAQTGFLDGPFIVPAFVLRELQFFADQADPIKRSKGRRGLEILERMRATPGMEFVVREFPGDAPSVSGTGEAVDDRLVRAALDMGAWLVTNDNGLAKVAGLQGVKCLSLNALAETLKPRHGAGDELTITVVKEGSQAGQGIGYLDDGTMVVIEDGLALRGRTVRVAVVSNIQTALGRMIFAKPKEVV